MGSGKAHGFLVIAATCSWAGLAWAQNTPPAPPPAAAPGAAPPAQAYPPAPPPSAQTPPPVQTPPPAQPQQQQQPYPAAPPPAGQAYPPPPGAYPPPGYPPPGTPYPPPGYAPPPPTYAAPPSVPVPQYPEDAATQASPFFDAVLLGVFADERFSDPLMFGAQIGGYAGGRVRLAARLALTTDPEDNSSYDYNYDYSVNYATVEDLPTLMYGGSVGLVVARRTKFVFAPGFMLARTDVADYGTLFGANFPFEWVMRSGVRVGFEAAIGRGFGGEARRTCTLVIESECTGGAEVGIERDPGVFFAIGVQIGFGLGYPEPDMPK